MSNKVRFSEQFKTWVLRHPELDDQIRIAIKHLQQFPKDIPATQRMINQDFYYARYHIGNTETVRRYKPCEWSKGLLSDVRMLYTFHAEIGSDGVITVYEIFFRALGYPDNRKATVTK